VRERPAFVTAWGPPRRAGISGDVIVRGEGRDGRGVPAPERHGYADPRNVYSLRGTNTGTPPRSTRGIGDPGIIVPRNNNAEPEESPYDRAIRVMNRRSNNDGNGSGVPQRNGSSNPGDGAPGRSGDAPVRGGIPADNRTPTYGNSYGTYGAYPRTGAVTRQPSRGDGERDRGDRGDTSPGVSRSPGQDDAPGVSRPRGYDGGGAVRRYGNGGSNGNNGNNDNDGGGDRSRRSGADSDRGPRYGDGGGRRSGGDDSGGGSSAGSSRERSAPAGGVSTPRHGGGSSGGGSSDGGGSSAGRSSDRGDRGGGSSAGRSSDGGSSGRSGGGGAVRRHP